MCEDTKPEMNMAAAARQPTSEELANQQYRCEQDIHDTVRVFMRLPTEEHGEAVNRSLHRYAEAWMVGRVRVMDH